MSTCPKCSKKLSCGCQRRKASDGKAVCSGCLHQYEKSLKPEPTKTINKPNLNTWGKDRYKNLTKFIK